MANQRVYQILVYRHELFKINFTGVPSSSPPVSPRFFPALSLALFFARAPLSERLEQASRSHDTGMTFIPERVHSVPIYFSVSVYMILRRS